MSGAHWFQQAIVRRFLLVFVWTIRGIRETTLEKGALLLKLCLAHVRRNDDGSFVTHHLEDHLRTVGDRAEATRS